MVFSISWAFKIPPENIPLNHSQTLPMISSIIALILAPFNPVPFYEIRTAQELNSKLCENDKQYTGGFHDDATYVLRLKARLLICREAKQAAED